MSSNQQLPRTEAGLAARPNWYALRVQRERQQQAARHEISSRASWQNHGEQWFRQKRTHQARAVHREQRDEIKIQNPHVEKFSRWLNRRGVQRTGR